MSVLTYDPYQVAAIVGGSIIQGYADGTFVTVARNADMWAMKVGTDGIGTRAKSSNKSGRITITLHQSSASNDLLSALAEDDELTNTGIFPFFLRDNSGRTLITALTAWIVKQADAEFALDVSNRVWIIESDDIEIFNGGN